MGETPKEYAEQKKSPITRMANASLLREAYTLQPGIWTVDRTASEVFKQDPLKSIKTRNALLVHAHRADDIMTALRIKDEFNIKMIIQHGTEALELLMSCRKERCRFPGPFLINRQSGAKRGIFKTQPLAQGGKIQLNQRSPGYLLNI